jgi:hypothetical protein
MQNLRCPHNPAETPLSCIQSIIGDEARPRRDDAAGDVNKGRFIIATQDPALRAWTQTVAGLPCCSLYNGTVKFMTPSDHQRAITQDVGCGAAALTS